MLQHYSDILAVLSSLNLNLETLSNVDFSEVINAARRFLSPTWRSSVRNGRESSRAEMRTMRVPSGLNRPWGTPLGIVDLPSTALACICLVGGDGVASSRVSFPP